VSASKRLLDDCESLGSPLLWPAIKRSKAAKTEVLPKRQLRTKEEGVGVSAELEATRLQVANGERCTVSQEIRRVARPTPPLPQSPPSPETIEKEVDRVVEVALQRHCRFLSTFEENVSLHGEPRAREIAEEEVASMYDEFCEFVAKLMRWTEHEQSSNQKAGGVVYDVAQFRGRSMAENPSASSRDHDADVTLDLMLARTESRRGCARDALCAVLATLSSRREMCWMHAYDVELPVRGYFAHALVDPTSLFRMSFKCDGSMIRPASLLVTHTLPLGEALQRMDQCGPLPFNPRVYCKEPGRQFALQEIMRSEPGEDERRQPADTLKHEPELHKLLRTRTPIVLLDAYVALAPRGISKKCDLSPIVREELVNLLRESKEQGRAVVFQVGGDDPHLLAQKVYLQPFFSQYGLRCGYLRWRGSASEPWAKEKRWDGRACLGIQLP